MKKKNKQCIICNATYSYCPTCGSDKNKPSWYSLFESDNCHTLYGICTDFRDKKITVTEAKKKLATCDISKLNEFNDGFKNIIEDILNANEEEVKETVEVSEDSKVIEDIKVETVEVQEEKNESTLSEKKTFKKK